MKNFPIKYNGKIYWISRAVAVVGYIFTSKDGHLCVLANKRGKGCPNYQGYWNVPCGYLDFDETTKEACIREIYEETNLEVKESYLHFFSVEDNPTKDDNQNVCFRYWSYDVNYGTQQIFAKGAEEDEVEEVKWIPIEELDNYDFAFNQKETLISIVQTYLTDELARQALVRFKNLKIN